MGKDLNRLKVVLAEKKRTNKWLAQKLGKDPATVSKWCTNTAQPSLETLSDIALLMSHPLLTVNWPLQSPESHILKTPSPGFSALLPYSVQKAFA